MSLMWDLEAEGGIKGDAQVADFGGWSDLTAIHLHRWVLGAALGAATTSWEEFLSSLRKLKGDFALQIQTSEEHLLIFMVGSTEQTCAKQLKDPAQTARQVWKLS